MWGGRGVVKVWALMSDLDLNLILLFRWSSNCSLVTSIAWWQLIWYVHWVCPKPPLLDQIPLDGAVWSGVLQLNQWLCGPVTWEVAGPVGAARTWHWRLVKFICKGLSVTLTLCGSEVLLWWALLRPFYNRLPTSVKVVGWWRAGMLGILLLEETWEAGV